MDKLLVEKIDQPAMDFSDSVSEKTLATIVQLIVDEEGNGSLVKNVVGFKYKKGDKFMKDKTADGKFHHKIMTKKIFPDIRKHFGKGKLKFDIALQQDGAGGHATKSEWSYKIEQDAEKKKPQIFFPYTASELAYP